MFQRINAQQLLELSRRDLKLEVSIIIKINLK